MRKLYSSWLVIYECKFWKTDFKCFVFLFFCFSMYRTHQYRQIMKSDKLNDMTIFDRLFVLWNMFTIEQRHNAHEMVNGHLFCWNLRWHLDVKLIGYFVQNVQNCVPQLRNRLWIVEVDCSCHIASEKAGKFNDVKLQFITLVIRCSAIGINASENFVCNSSRVSCAAWRCSILNTKSVADAEFFLISLNFFGEILPEWCITPQTKW